MPWDAFTTFDIRKLLRTPNLRPLPFISRKASAAVFAQACRMGLEGIVSKRLDKPGDQEIGSRPRNPIAGDAAISGRVISLIHKNQLLQLFPILILHLPTFLDSNDTQ
jgi:hypothetical protein